MAEQQGAFAELAAITDPGHPWADAIRFGAQLAEHLAAELPDISSPDATEHLLNAQLEEFAEDVARGIVGRPQERHAIVLARRGRHHALMEAIWRHVDRLRTEEGA
jgi:hypothetical protein